MAERSSILAYIALGANLGDRAANIAAALEILGRSPGVTVTRVSSLLENPAIGGPAGAPAFLNAVAEMQTSLDPGALLGRLLETERQLGRIRKKKWEPRIIDLDLLLYGDRVIRSPDLIIPHPLMHERQFVLKPLVEIAPEAIHPTLGASAAELLRRIR